MHVRCPHCQQPVDLAEKSAPDQIGCTSCGSVFSVGTDATAISLLENFDKPAATPAAAETTRRASDAAVMAKPIEGRAFGEYELLAEIARGGMGVVYKARQRRLNRTVAVKMILAGELADQEDVKRFLSEAEAAAGLDHPGIVPVYESGEIGGQHFFSMGFVEGESLAALLAAGPLPPKRAAELVAQVADAVEYAHERGVIHRDLKPGNILLDKDGHPRVTDFGLAKRVAGDSGLTRTGQALGTPSYMPPEQASGKLDAIGPPADVYALGAVLYAALTGRPPFQAATPLDTILQLLEREPVNPRHLNADIPPDLETITLKCLEKEPHKRYATAKELADELRRFLRGEPIHARPAGIVERAFKWANRNPAAAAWLAAVPLLTVFGESSGILGGCVATGITVPLVANRRLIIFGATLGVMLALLIVDLESRSKSAMQQSAQTPGVKETYLERALVPLFAMVTIGLLTGIVVSSFRIFFPRGFGRPKTVILCLAVGAFALAALSIPYFPVLFHLDMASAAPSVQGLWGVLLARGGIMWEGLCAVLMGLGFGLIEGQWVRDHSPRRAPEPGMLTIRGMLGAIIGIAAFQIIWWSLAAMNPIHFLAYVLRYSFAVYSVFRQLFLCLGSFLGVFLGATIALRNARSQTWRESFAADSRARAIAWLDQHQN
jgi:tRNA A-37 threonylcarbamoyl transferase component Bud32